MKFETVEAYALAGIGLLRGIGELAVREMGHRAYDSLRALTPFDPAELTAFINEQAKDYIDASVETLELLP